VCLRMQKIVNRWLVARSATDRPLSVKRFELALYRFTVWLNDERPAIASFAQVTRDDVLQYLVVLSEQPSPRTGQPLGPLARRGHVSALSQFFRNTAAWEWDDTPRIERTSDQPRRPLLDTMEGASESKLPGVKRGF